MINRTLLDLTTEIIAAHASNNYVSPDQLQGALESIYRSLAALGTSDEPTVGESPKPAVSLRASVKPNSIICLECGAGLKVLKRHLSVEHLLTIDDYRERWDLPASYPTVAPDYARKRRELALSWSFGSDRKRMALPDASQAARPESAVPEAAVALTGPKAVVTAKQYMAKNAPSPATEQAVSKTRKKLGIRAE